MSVCTFPTCGCPATTANRAAQPMCGSHACVVVAANASYLGEGDQHRSAEGMDN